ncbi:hypothetical protein F5880DRAFT_1607038 [Lentinula raphanica]|nr:hypothetical protein F5880DRAFT_1607038 [Lentinula raphanica]
MSLSPIHSREPRPGSSRPWATRTSFRNNTVSISSDVIEITDSESEEELAGPMKSSRTTSQSDPPLFQKQSTTKPLGATNFAQNVPSSSTRGNPAGPIPLFMPSDEEENVPPTRQTYMPPNSEGIEEVQFKHPEVELAQQELQFLEDHAENDTQSSMLAQVLELVPDVQPAYAEELIAQHSVTRPGEVLEAVINALFEDPSYPKLDKKGKRKATEQPYDEGHHKKQRLDDLTLDYSRTDREYKGSVHYTDLSIEQLMVDFPDIPKPYIRTTLYAHKCLYAPTHLYLANEKANGPLHYVPKKTLYKPSSKGKHRALEDVEFSRERAWLLDKLKEDEVRKDATVAEQVNQTEYEECGDGIECGCCFTTYPFDNMIQCPDAHLFCSECMSSYAENLLGAHNVNINCMDQSGCKLPFPESELRRFLSEKLWELYNRVKQRKEIEMAGLEGLEECPFCEYKCVIENPEEKLFRCGNEETCGAITCRQCKKMDHVPKSCKEMEEDRVLDGRHAIEEAMTRALMRNCPKCQKAFVKEEGCNKMTCPNCHTLSCYVCRQQVTGYDHFNQAPAGAPGSSSSTNRKKCPLWEPVEKRHAEEVKTAAQEALEKYKRENPDVNETDIKIDAPKTPRRQPNADLHGYGLPGMPRQNPYGQQPDLLPYHAYYRGAFNYLDALLPPNLPAPAPAFAPPPAPPPPMRARRQPAQRPPAQRQPAQRQPARPPVRPARRR